MATMATMAVMATMTRTTTMMKMRRTMDTGRCCASDLCRGIGGVVDGDMDAAFVVSTMTKGDLFRTTLISLVT